MNRTVLTRTAGPLVLFAFVALSQNITLAAEQDRGNSQVGTEVGNKASRNLDAWKGERISRIEKQDPHFKAFREKYERTPESDKRELLLKFLASGKYGSAPLLSFVISEIGAYEDAEVVAALERRKAHGGSDPEGVYNIAVAATRSLDRIRSAPDFRKLKPETPMTLQEPMIAKYSAMWGYNRDAMYAYLLEQSERDPATFVPLTVLYYAGESVGGDRTQKLAEQYPDHADKGLERCLEDTNATFVSSCVGLIGKLKKEKYLQRIFDVAYDGKGKYDPARVKTIQHYAEATYFSFGAKSVPYLEKMLYGETITSTEKDGVIGLIRHTNAREVKGILQRFKMHCMSDPVRNKDLLERVNRELAAIEDAE